MMRRFYVRARRGSIPAVLALAALALAGCSSTVAGEAVPGTVAAPGVTTETVTPSGPATPSPAPSSPGPSSTPQEPPTAIPDNGNGFTFMATKSGKTRCRVSVGAAGCQLLFDKPGPKTESGDPANGVNVARSGALTYVLGDIGVANPVTLDYRTYTARGWTIVATYEATRFTNDATGHGMVVNTSGAQAF